MSLSCCHQCKYSRLSTFSCSLSFFAWIPSLPIWFLSFYRCCLFLFLAYILFLHQLLVFPLESVSLVLLLPYIILFSFLLSPFSASSSSLILFPRLFFPSGHFSSFSFTASLIFAIFLSELITSVHSFLVSVIESILSRNLFRMCPMFCSVACSILTVVSSVKLESYVYRLSMPICSLR